jgi:ABC-type transport system involved in cytochrome bd biosynthesis fused ATPase/permease subunit
LYIVYISQANNEADRVASLLQSLRDSKEGGSTTAAVAAAVSISKENDEISASATEVQVVTEESRQVVGGVDKMRIAAESTASKAVSGGGKSSGDQAVVVRDDVSGEIVASEQLLEKLNEEKLKIKGSISAWITAFTKKHGVAPSAEDKKDIRGLYVDFKKVCAITHCFVG